MTVKKNARKLWIDSVLLDSRASRGRSESRCTTDRASNQFRFDSDMNTPSCWWLYCCSEVEGHRPRSATLCFYFHWEDVGLIFFLLSCSVFSKFIIDFCLSSKSHCGSKKQRCEVTKQKLPGRFLKGSVFMVTFYVSISYICAHVSVLSTFVGKTRWLLL